jgi:hypothetical protein
MIILLDWPPSSDEPAARGIPRKDSSFCFDLGQPAGESFLMLGEIDQ